MIRLLLITIFLFPHVHYSRNDCSKNESFATYDKANQLLTSTRNGKVTKFEYDAAGRLIREGNKVYFYGCQDKILTVTVNGKKKLTFDYHMDGQLASAGGNGGSEEFLWGCSWKPS